MNTWVYCDHPPGRYQQTPRLAPWPEKLRTGTQQNEMGMHWVERHGVKASGHPVCAEGAFQQVTQLFVRQNLGSQTYASPQWGCWFPAFAQFLSIFIFLPVSAQTDDTSSLSRLLLHHRTSLLLWRAHYSTAFSPYTSHLSSLFLQGFSARASNLESSFPGRHNNISFS